MAAAYRLLTPSVKVQLLIYFMLKYAMEILLSESSVVTTYYFGWSTGTVAIFLACLGLTVLPVNVVVGSYISNMFEDRQILLASEIVVFLGILGSFNVFIPYSVPQYVCFGLIMFVAVEVLEVRLAVLGMKVSCSSRSIFWHESLMSNLSLFLRWSPFTTEAELPPVELAESAKAQFSARDFSDHLALVRAYEGWKDVESQKSGYEYCWKNFLSAQTLKAIDSLRKQFSFLLKETGLVDSF